jgi:hypothetical protein
VCKDGRFSGFECPSDRDAGTPAGGIGGSAGAGSGGSGGKGGGVCNLLCVRGKHCELVEVQCIRAPCPAQPQCVDDGADAGSGALHWVPSCGAPVCTADPKLFDDPNIPNCTTEHEGDACANAGDRCDGVLSCGATLLCAEEAPTNCPISRKRYKQDIAYLDDAARARIHEQLVALPLAHYRYKTAPEVPQLGFMIDDVEPSVAVAGDHVNMYGYLSMAVAAIQVQDAQIKALEQQVDALRARLDEQNPAGVCAAAE